MLILTRPRDQAEGWLQALATKGVAAANLPLLDIQPAPDPQTLTRAWASLDQYRAVFFVSPSAVQQFFHARPGSLEGGSPGHWMAVAPGPGTARELERHGVLTSQIVQPAGSSEQFDSEALWPLLSGLPWSGQRVLAVRGEGGREWLLDQWRQAGALVDTVAAYRRGPPTLQAPERALLSDSWARPQDFVWLFSSSQALDQLMPLLSGLGHPVFPDHAHAAHAAEWAQRARALATHPRIHAHALTLGWTGIQACRPEIEDVVRSYNRLHRVP